MVRREHHHVDLANRVDMNLLPMLAALIEHRSVTKAANAVGLTQPAMSNALARLRRALGDELLVRVGREYVLTTRAEALIEPLNTILETVASDILTPLTFDPSTSTRTFHIAAASGAALAVLPALSAAVASTAPGVRIHVEPATASLDLGSRDSKADVALVPEGVAISLPRERLYLEDWIVIADAANEGIGDELTKDQLFRMPHVIFEWGGERSGAQKALDAMAPELPVQVVVPEFLMIPSVVRGTNMLALLQRGLASRLAEMNGLKILEPPVPLPNLSIDLVWNPHSAGDPGRAWLRRHLKRAVASVH